MESGMTFFTELSLLEQASLSGGASVQSVGGAGGNAIAGPGETVIGSPGESGTVVYSGEFSKVNIKRSKANRKLVRKSPKRLR